MYSFFQTIDSVVTNDSLQALVKQFYGLTIAYDEVTYVYSSMREDPQLVISTV